MGNERRHLHILSECRNHPNERELAPLGPQGGVFATPDEAEEALDTLVEARNQIDLSQEVADSLIDLRAPGLLLMHTVPDPNDPEEAEPERPGDAETEYDGRCHRLFVTVWCFGDPEECRASIMTAGLMDLIQAMSNGMVPGLKPGSDAERQADAFRAMMQQMMDIEDDDEPKIGFGRPEPQQPSLANEPFDDLDLFDFGGFDEPTDPKRLN
jgi:hypothetical protein